MIPPWQDIAIGLGTFVGLVTKSWGLWDTDTRWNRRAALTNATLYIPSIAAFWTLGLVYTTVLTTLSMFLWFGIGIWRPIES